MKSPKSLYSHSLKSQVNSGFTLIELLLASFMTFFVVSATGYAMFTVMKENITVIATSDLQKNIDRAVSFITLDIRESQYAYSTEAEIKAAAPDFSATGKT